MPTVSSSAKMIAYGDPNLQDVVTGVENADAVRAYLNVETPTGTIALKKTSEDGVVAGISFVIKGEKNFNQTVTTDENGNITVEGLFPGTYTVTEQSIDKYEPQETQTITLIGGKTIYLSVKEFEVLYILYANPMASFTKEQIYSAVWNEPPIGGCHAVENTIFQIRKKIGCVIQNQDCIKTIVGYGYKFNLCKH